MNAFFWETNGVETTGGSFDVNTNTETTWTTQVTTTAKPVHLTSAWPEEVALVSLVILSAWVAFGLKKLTA